MGARWPWHAICENGHITGNFSGGSDNECYQCGARIIGAHNCWMWGCECECDKEELMWKWREWDRQRV